MGKSPKNGSATGELAAASTALEAAFVQTEPAAVPSLQNPVDPLAATQNPGALHTDPRPAHAEQFPVQNWERYEFICLLGEGGMGAVYQARDRRLRRLVALKFIRGNDARLTQRFMQEARAQARIEHPHICKVFEVGEVDGKAYISMQFVDGPSLQQARPQLSMLNKVALIKQAAEALHAAHQLGIIHRDIKPANILVERQGETRLQPVIMDFGLARDGSDAHGMTESGAVMGTAAFMSPEQARGNAKALDRRSDVYSLGATLFDLIAGRPPFIADSVAETLLKVMGDAPPRLSRLAPETPETLEIIVDKCLNKEPGQRYVTAQDLADDLGRFLDNQRILGKRLSLYQRLRWQADHNRPAAAGMGAFILSLLVLVGVGIRVRWQAIKRDRLAAQQVLIAQQQARQQAELAQRLGQEIRDMEWMLRSARQMPLHDLGREKKIVRERMARLQKELSGYGELGRGLGYYALGRGHMALHEYSAALEQLTQAMAAGNQRSEVQYALGYVLGKHYEQAMANARLSGGADWARKQQKDLELRYLSPAIQALRNSRGTKLDTSAHLESLIAYYQGDYDGARERAREALHAAPWLYEVHKLLGDFHLQRGLRAFDRAAMTEADRELVLAITDFEHAAQIGQSDAEVYESLADTWIQRVAVAQQSGQTVQGAYAQAQMAAQKLSQVAPESVVSSLKQAYALQWRIVALDPSDSLADLSRDCQEHARRVLRKEPSHPFATGVLSTCMSFSAHAAQLRREDPGPLRQAAVSVLAPIVERNPQFLEGIRNLSFRLQELARYQQRRGDRETYATFKRAIEMSTRAIALDSSDAAAISGRAEQTALVLAVSLSQAENRRWLAQLEEDTQRCHGLVGEHYACQTNRLSGYATAAERAWLAGEDAKPLLQAAQASLTRLKKQDAQQLEIEQMSTVVHLLTALIQRQSGDNPRAEIAEVKQAAARCRKLAARDPVCLSLDARGAWLAAEAAGGTTGIAKAELRRALALANQASESPDATAETWQVLAETHLRLARTAKLSGNSAEVSLSAADAALEKLQLINPHFGLGFITAAELRIQRATIGSSKQRSESIQQAKQALKQAKAEDATLSHAVDRLYQRIAELADNK